MVGCTGKTAYKERMERMHIHLDDDTCCLCDDQSRETASHLFGSCTWFKQVLAEVSLWTKDKFLVGNRRQVLLAIKRKHRKQFMNEFMAAVWGAIIYHTWRAKNLKNFKGITVHTSDVVTLIRQDLVERVDFLKASKKARRCRFVQNILI
ncbi:hypothetical protein HAX54_023580 [Datura stramonium]|uniref:Reverse transcriptase zinc-binding domain-containing protein n=1 Tax=Datura stramonium TaxID=4076 RepID=A0ABS8UYK9_DATST|nr:hypothetical protein [Datura stramonium]